MSAACRYTQQHESSALKEQNQNVAAKTGNVSLDQQPPHCLALQTLKTLHLRGIHLTPVEKVDSRVMLRPASNRKEGSPVSQQQDNLHGAARFIVISFIHE